HLAGLAVADRPLAVAALDPADRTDDRGGAAAEHLGDLTGGAALLPLVDADPALLGGDAEVGGEPEHGVAGDAGEQRAGRGAGEQAGLGAGAGAEHEVPRADLLDPAAFRRVEPDDLGAAVLDGLGLPGEGGRVVAAELRLAGAAGG